MRNWSAVRGAEKRMEYDPRPMAEFAIRSKLVDQEYRIRVLEPAGVASRSEKLPVLYVTDSDDFYDALATITNVMQLLGDVRRFILVGIGYGSSAAARLLRWRDLVTHSIREAYRPMLERLIASPLVTASCSIETITSSDAGDFLQFICTELMPLINERYATSPFDRYYYGYSAGGTFGLYALFTRTDAFRGYILGSPGTSYDGRRFAIDMARQFLRSGAPTATKAFVSVGELEEFEKGFESLNIVSGYYDLIRYLKSAEIPGFCLRSYVFPEETHATAWLPAFSRGVRSVLNPLERTAEWRDLFQGPANT
jgi:uncharacterized protein